MRVRLIGAAACLAALALTLGPAGGAYAVSGANAHHDTTTGHQHFEVYATNFMASYSPVYFTGVINTVGTGYKDFAEAQDQVYMPNAGGTLVIYHPGLTQTEGTTVTFDPNTCVTHITGSGPAHFINGTGAFRHIHANGVVNLDIKVFARKNADGSCNSTDPPIGYIEIAIGDLTVTLDD